MASAVVAVRAPGNEPTSFRLEAQGRTYSVRARPVGGVVLIELRAPTWSRSGEPVEQGVRVERVHVEPAA